MTASFYLGFVEHRINNWSLDKEEFTQWKA
jgi:hypothetical protein